MRKTTLTMAPFRWLHPTLKRSRTRNWCQQLSVPKHLTLPFPCCLHKSSQPAISYGGVTGVHGRQARVHTPVLCGFKADLSPLEASCWLSWVLHHVVSRAISGRKLWVVFRYNSYQPIQEQISSQNVKLTTDLTTDFMCHLQQELPCPFQPSLLTYPKDGLFLRHPFSSKQNPGKKPAELPSLPCPYQPEKKEEED